MNNWRRWRNHSRSTAANHRKSGSVVAALTPMALLVFWVALLHLRNEEQMLNAALATSAETSRSQAGASLELGMVGAMVGTRSATENESIYKLFDWLASGCNVRSTEPLFLDASAAVFASLVEPNGAKLAILSAEDYIDAKQLIPGLELLATELRWDDDRARLIDSTTVCLVALKSRAELAQLPAGDIRLRVTFTSRDSLSGYRYPSALLAQVGVQAGSYDELFVPSPTDALLNGSTDLAAVTDIALRRARAMHGDVFRIIRQSDPLPYRCVVASPHLPAPMREKVVAMLVDVDPKLIEGLGTHGFVKRPDSFYDTTRQLLNVPTN